MAKISSLGASFALSCIVLIIFFSLVECNDGISSISKKNDLDNGRFLSEDMIKGGKLKDVGCAETTCAMGRDCWCCTRKEIRNYCYATQKVCLNACLGIGSAATPQAS
ncbi:PREDICTED: uncharacterized protein LOC101296383 [Fragaria vesca subsp. vesca]